MAYNMDNNNNAVNPADLDQWLAQNPEFMNDFGNDGLMTDTDTESLNPADLSLNTNFNDFQMPQELVPALPEPQVPQMPIPNFAAGPVWHPQLGWHYPCAAPVGITPPQMMIPIAGVTPVASVPTSAFPSGTSTPIPAAADKPLRPQSNKRKYGPSAYLDARAEGRNSIPTEEANYFASSASRRDGRGNTSNGIKTLDNAFRRVQTRPSIVQACVCDDRETERIRRPKNAFILYRLAKADEIRKRMGTTSNQVVSAEAGREWKAADPSVKDPFYKLAEAEKQRHAEKYPGYVYRPGGSSRSKFGTPTCTCGAYELNMARVNEKRLAAGATAIDSNMADSDAEDAYVPARARPQAPAPMANMQRTPPPQPMSLEALGLTGLNPTLQAEMLAAIEKVKRKAALSVETGREPTSEPPRKRRSPRSGAGNINYAEPSDETPFDFNADDLFDFSAPCKTPSSSQAERYQPSPKSLRSSTSRQRSSSALFVTPSPTVPAKNTRSQSRANILESIETTHEQSPIKIEDSDDEAEEDIVVAMKTARKTTKSTASQASQASRRSTRSQTTTRRGLRSSGR